MTTIYEIVDRAGHPQEARGSLERMSILCDRMNEAGDCNAQPYRVEVVVRPQTGAEKYLQGRLKDPEYREAYEAMRAEMSKHD